MFANLIGNMWQIQQNREGKLCVFLYYSFITEYFVVRKFPLVGSCLKGREELYKQKLKNYRRKTKSGIIFWSLKYPMYSSFQSQFPFLHGKSLLCDFFFSLRKAYSSASKHVAVSNSYLAVHWEINKSFCRHLSGWKVISQLQTWGQGQDSADVASQAASGTPAEIM